MRRVFANAVSLYVVQFAGFILPLFALPYLTRVLGPSGFGAIAVAQSLSLWASIVIEFGFNLSATRIVANHRENPDKLADVAAGVLGAKLLLSSAMAFVLILVRFTVPVFRSQPDLLVWVFLSTVAMGFSPIWFFQGIERLIGVSALEFGLRTVALGMTFWIVRSTSDVWKYLALNASAGLLTTAITLGLVYRNIKWKRPTVSAAVRAIRHNSRMFVFRGVEQLYTSTNAFILGLLAPADVVGYFSGAERLARAGASLMGPLSQAFYPFMNRLVVGHREQAAGLTRWLLVVLGSLGVLAAAGGTVVAPWIIPLVLGADYGPSVASFRLLVWLVPLRAINSILTLQWLLPHGLESAVSTSIARASLIGLLVAMILVPRMGQLGMAIAAISAEATAVAFLIRTAWAVRHESAQGA